MIRFSFPQKSEKEFEMIGERFFKGSYGDGVHELKLSPELMVAVETNKGTNIYKNDELVWQERKKST